MTTLHDLRAEPRPMWQALAQQLAACRPSDVKLKLLNDLYCRMSPSEKLACRAELHAIRCARRGQIEARIK